MNSRNEPAQPLSQSISEASEGFIFTCKYCGFTGPCRRKTKDFCNASHRSKYRHLKKEIACTPNSPQYPKTVDSAINQFYATVQEAARMAAVCETTIRRQIKLQRLRSWLHFGRLLVNRDSLRKWITLKDKGKGKKE